MESNTAIYLGREENPHPCYRFLREWPVLENNVRLRKRNKYGKLTDTVIPHFQTLRRILWKMDTNASLSILVLHL